MFVPVRSRPVVQIKKLYIYIKMKKVLFITALVTLASCSNKTSTSSKDSVCADSTCSDSMNTDSLIESVNAHADSLHTEIQELKK
jgi:hypothetical protein